MRKCVEGSKPLVALTKTRAFLSINGKAREYTARAYADGMAPTMMSAWANAWARSLVIATAGGIAHAGRYSSFTRLLLTAYTKAGSRIHKESSCGLWLRDNTMDNAVPQLPPPRMAILVILFCRSCRQKISVRHLQRAAGCWRRVYK